MPQADKWKLSTIKTKRIYRGLTWRERRNLWTRISVYNKTFGAGFKTVSVNSGGWPDGPFTVTVRRGE